MTEFRYKGIKNIIGIFGVPRSGTSWLGQLFDSSPQVSHKWQPFFSNSFKDYLPVNASKEQIHSFYRAVIDLEDNYLDRSQKRESGLYPFFKQKNAIPSVLVHKEISQLYHIPSLLKAIDNIKLIFLVRNPNAVINSFYKAPSEFEKSWDLMEEWQFANKKNKFSPYYYYGFQKWKEAMNLFLQVHIHYPQKTKLVKYEDLFLYPEAELRKLFSFANIEMTTQTLHFVNESTSKHSDDAYSVFRGNKKLEDWKSSLPIEIEEKIAEELNETPLSQFLS